MFGRPHSVSFYGVGDSRLMKVRKGMKNGGVNIPLKLTTPFMRYYDFFLK